MLFLFSFATTYHLLIKKLTNDKLVLRFKVTIPSSPTVPGAPYTEHEEIYSRRLLAAKSSRI